MAISHGVNTANASPTTCCTVYKRPQHADIKVFGVWIAYACKRILVTLHMSTKGSYKPQTQLLSICTHILVMPASMLETYARRQLSEIKCHDHHGSPLQDGDPKLLQHYADASHPREYTKRSVSSSVYACTV